MITCKYCVATKGLTMSSDHIFKTDEELFNHIEMVHDIPVRRKGETEEACMVRFKDKNSRAGGPDCQCPDCLAKRGSHLAGIYKLISLVDKSSEGKE